MKKIILLAVLLCACTINAQAYKGKGDIKAQVGLNIQNGGTGIHVSTDFGLGENISIGFSGTYLLSAADVQKFDSTGLVINENAAFVDKIDIKARFNANLGNVFKLNPKMDIYPGLDLSLKNFGGHVGFRYFFTTGFGVFAEAGAPIARYKNNLSAGDHYNNQAVFNIGASFNL